MKIKVVDLKTNLSKVLRDIQSSGETLEVCVRESTVAYLSPIHPKQADTNPAREANQLSKRLAEVGLMVDVPHLPSGPISRPKIHRAGDERTDVSTAQGIRAEKNW
jgi:antitoxin (DNA-binding transcriptional repressor) of toxin-antitoxin stability system